MNEILREKAKRIKELDDEISNLEGNAKTLRSEREALSDDLVAEMQAMALDNGEGVRVAEIGFIKLESKSYPKILDFDGLHHWATTNGVELPAPTINAQTFGAWMREQYENSKPLPPEELVKPYIKTRIKILK
jgi:hypothetical protein